MMGAPTSGHFLRALALRLPRDVERDLPLRPSARASPQDERRRIAWLLILHDLDLLANGVQLVPDEARTAEGTEIEEQEAPRSPALDEGARCTLETIGQCHNVTGAAQAFPSEFPIGTEQQQRRHVLLT